jgi:ankyrin repeat protein
LNKGADVRAKDNSGFTALVYAAKPEIARMLLEKGSDPNPRGLDNMTPLIKASAYGNLELARTFIRKGTDLNAKDNLGRSALTAAIENGFPEIAHIFLRARADIEVADKNGLTPLMRATSGHQLEIMRILLDRGADPNTKNKAGDSALVYAIGNAEAIALLVDKGADVNLRYGTDGITVLMMAAARGEYRVAETLLKNGAEVNLKSQKGETALSLAQRFGHKQLVNLLQKHGASE